MTSDKSRTVRVLQYCVVPIILGVTFGIGGAFAKTDAKNYAWGDYNIATTEDWSFEVALLDSAVVPYQSIWIRMACTNISNKPLARPKLAIWHDFIEVVIYSGNGDKLCIVHDEAQQIAKTRPEILNPGESVSGYLDIASIVCANRQFTAIPYLSPDRYRVEVSFLPAGSEVGDTLKVTLSNLVLRRLSPRETQALRLFEQAYQLLGRDNLASQQKYEEVLDEYSETAYDELANRALIFGSVNIFKKYDRKGKVELRRRYLLAHPGSAYNDYDNIPALASWLSNEELARLYVEIKDRPRAIVSIAKLESILPSTGSVNHE